ncbi:MAG: HlyD family secretion protein [Planctomycetaceae bacterium]
MSDSLATDPGQSRTSSVSLSDRVKSLQLPQDSPSRHAASEIVAWLLCVALSAFGGWLAWEKWNPPPPASLLEAKPGSPPNAVAANSGANTSATSTKTADNKKEGLVHTDSGYIIPAHQILVSPKVSGMVLTLNVEEGLRVQKGDILAVLESVDYDADVRRSQATLQLSLKRLEELERGTRPEEIKQAEAELAETQVNLDDLERTYKRNKDLFAKKGATEQELLSSEANLFAMRRRLSKLNSMVALLREGPRIERIEQAKAEVQQAEADVSKATWRQSNCTIKAPISGTILKKNAEEGNIVNPVAFNGSFSLCDMADLSDLEVDLSVQESNISKVFKGQRCKVQPDAFKDRSYDAYVHRLMPIADRSKGAVPIRVKVIVPADEEGVFLKPEMHVTVWFYGDEKPAE